MISLSAINGSTIPRAAARAGAGTMRRRTLSLILSFALLGAAQVGHAAPGAPPARRKPPARPSRAEGSLRVPTEHSPGLPVGGQHKAFEELWEVLELPLKRPELFRSRGVSPPIGVLLFGPPRNGKTLLARTLAERTGAHLELVSAPDLVGGSRGDAEAALREVFDRAAQHAPAIVVLDEVDAIAAKRVGAGEDAARLTTQLLSLLDGVHKREGVVVVATTNRPEALDPALRQAGRLEREIHVGTPDAVGRHEILQIHTKDMPLGANVALREVADAAHGMSGGDLASLAREAGMRSIRRILQTEKDDAAAAAAPAALRAAQKKIERAGVTLDAVRASYDAYLAAAKQVHARPGEAIDYRWFEEVVATALPTWKPWLARNAAGYRFDATRDHWGVEPREDGGYAFVIDAQSTTDRSTARYHLTYPPRRSRAETEPVTQDDFVGALAKLKPATVREFTVETPKLSWDDVAGLADAKHRLREAVEFPVTNAKGYQRLKLRSPRGVLLFGPPGVGKTLLAQVVASQAKKTFISVKASDLLTMWYGESSRNIAEMFSRAAAAGPSVLFIDEFEALAPARGHHSAGEPMETERVVAQFLAEMNGLGQAHGVTVMAATNHPEKIDPAVLRPGRFDSIVYVGLPDLTARRQAFAIHTRGRPLAKDVHLEHLAKRTEHYSGADIEGICNSAGLAALREDPDARHIASRHFELALSERGPSVTAEARAAYERLAEQLVSEPRTR